MRRKKSDTVDHVESNGGESATTVAASATPPPGADFKLWEGAVLIPIDKLIFTSWNVNEMSDGEFAELVNEIEEGGFDEPADVVPSKEQPGHFLVLGGEHRTRACHALNYTEVPCTIKSHLIDADEATLKMWSVKRNNIRGKINEQKYRELERSLSEKHQIQLEAARQRMLVKGELLKTVQKAEAERNAAANAPSGGDDGRGDAAGNSKSGDGPATDGERDKKKELRDRKKLLDALKTAEEEVLLQSSDTVEHGYLFFAQSDKLHLVVDSSPKLAGLVKRAVAACKNESAKIDDLLAAAIEAELTQWETK